MYLNHRFAPRIFMAEEGAPSGTPPIETASIFDGISVSKDGLSKTVSGDELRGPEKPPEIAPVPPKAGAVPLEAREKGPSHARFKEVTDARDKVQKELEEAKKAWEAKEADYQSKLGKGEVPEEFKTQLAEALSSKTKLEADLRGLIATRAAQAEFEPRKTAALEKIGMIATIRGDQAMLNAAKSGNYEALAEIAESGDLTALQKRDVDRLLNEARGYDEQLSQLTKDPDAAWKALEERNRAQMDEARKVQLANNLNLANETHSSLLKTVTALAGVPELSKEIKSRLTALAGGDGSEKYTARNMMQVVAEHAIFENLCKNQQTKIQKLEADLKEKTEALNRVKSPNFRPSHVEPELEEETVGTGLFSPGGGLVVNTGR